MIFKPFLREEFIPLPVTFISTVSKEGVRNIAPYSCIMPVLRPLDLICLASALRRDTLDNIRATGEFVVNLAGEKMAGKVVPTARQSGPEVDEFVEAGLREKPSHTIRAPGIAGCYAWMECTLFEEHRGEGYSLVVGQVKRLEVDDSVLNQDRRLDLEKTRPLFMAGGKGMRFCTVGELGLTVPFGAMFPDGKDPLAKRYE